MFAGGFPSLAQDRSVRGQCEPSRGSLGSPKHVLLSRGRVEKPVQLSTAAAEYAPGIIPSIPRLIDQDRAGARMIGCQEFSRKSDTW